MVEIETHDPSGMLEVTERHAPRLPTLAGRRVGLLSNEQWQAHRALPILQSMLEADFPGIEVIPSDRFPQGNAVLSEDATVQLVKDSGVDAVIIGNAACGSCSTSLGQAAAKLERLGVPTVLMARSDFVGVVKNAVSGLGFVPDTPMVTFPVDTFLPGSDLASVAARRQEFYDGLMQWRPAVAEAGTAQPMIRIQGETYEDALAQFNHMMLTNMWGDGLPLWPATPRRVDWMLRGTAMAADHVLGKFMPRGAVTTVQSCAVALAMAGGRPEYLPVLIAAVQAFLDPVSHSEKLQAESASVFPVVIVNGPVARAIRLNSTFGCLGPDPQRPAGGSIGRALRLMQQNLGGALPGIGGMGQWGAMRYTNAVFAEDEEAFPPDWPAHGTERHGFAPGSNSVSLVFATGVTNIRRRSPIKGIDPAEDVRLGLLRMADYMRAPNLGCLAGWTEGTPGVMLLSPLVARTMAEQGWDKRKIRELLWEQSRVRVDHLRETGADSWIEINADPQIAESIRLDPWPCTSKPDNIVLLVAGGAHPSNSYWMEAYCPHVIGRPIELPEGFEGLLKEADRDIGCGADACLI